MSGFLADVDANVVAQIDQRYASICAGQASILAKTPKPGDGPEDTFARLLNSMPPDMDEVDAKFWLCAALTQLAHSKKDNSEERAE